MRWGNWQSHSTCEKRLSWWRENWREILLGEKLIYKIASKFIIDKRLLQTESRGDSIISEFKRTCCFPNSKQKTDNRGDHEFVPCSVVRFVLVGGTVAMLVRDLQEVIWEGMQLLNVCRFCGTAWEFCLVETRKFNTFRGKNCWLRVFDRVVFQTIWNSEKQLTISFLTLNPFIIVYFRKNRSMWYVQKFSNSLFPVTYAIYDLIKCRSYFVFSSKLKIRVH